MKSKKISIGSLWKFPYGTQVFLTDEQIKMIEPELEHGVYTYCAKDRELGDLLVDEYGEIVWNSGELSEETVTVYATDTLELVKGYIRGLVAYDIILQEEPFLHAETLKFIEVNLRNMRALEDLLDMDQQFN